MTEEEKKAYDNLLMLKYFTMEKEDKESIDIILKLIDKQDTEINKLNNVIDDLVGEVAYLNYETIGEWCNKDKGYKCQNCNTNNVDCIKEYFIKENTNE